MCGTINPTNPIGPAIDTDTPAKIITSNHTIMRTISVLCPKPLAMSSPNSIIIS